MSDFDQRIDRLLAAFGIDQQMIACPRQPEATSLVSLGLDALEREQFATPNTAAAWTTMRDAARQDGIELQLISAFRSVDYQCTLIQRKIERGQTLDEILRVSAAPGYSEHHTGRALDLNTPGCDMLTEQFEETEAFAWLCGHAGRFGFTLSYPRDNPYGIDYEPWHWAFNGDQT